MPHIAYCTDRKDLGDQRQTALADHLAYIETILDRIAVAGPVASGPDGSTEPSSFNYHTHDRQEPRLHSRPPGVTQTITVLQSTGGCACLSLRKP
ncbi:MAG: hypothetical protein VW016_04005 [Luminiphilus sp.]